MIIALQILALWLASDFLTGLMHWTEDTWAGLGVTPWLDRWIVEDNLLHHERPGDMQHHGWWETNCVCIFLAMVIGGIVLLCHTFTWQWAVFLLFGSHSNQVHKWAHTSRVPFPVKWMQAIGLMQSRRHHAEHHKRPYEVRFCTQSEYLNPILEGVHFWRALEWAVQRFGVPMRRGTELRRGV